MTLRYEQTCLALKTAQALLKTSMEDEAKVLFAVNALVREVAEDERKHNQSEIDWLTSLVKGFRKALTLDGDDVILKHRNHLLNLVTWIALNKANQLDETGRRALLVALHPFTVFENDKELEEKIKNVRSSLLEGLANGDTSLREEGLQALQGSEGKTVPDEPSL